MAHQVVVNGLHWEKMSGGVNHGGPEAEAGRVLDHHIVDQILWSRGKRGLM